MAEDETFGNGPAELGPAGDPVPLVSDALAPSTPGARWWMYRRLESGPALHHPTGPLTDTPGETPVPASLVPVANSAVVPTGGDGPWRADAPDLGAGSPVVQPGVDLATGRRSTAALAGGLGALLIIVVMVGVRVGNNNLGLVLMPLAGLAIASAFGRAFASSHPDEPWLGRLLVYGVVAKLIASYLRYQTLVVGYGGIGDSADYDEKGRKFVAFWTGNGRNPNLPDLKKTNFLRWFTGAVYYLFGTNLVAGFLIFGLLAVIGSYFWYRATCDAVPFINKRLYFLLVFFAPSILFWPSSIGKEALMQLGVGTVALGTAHLLRGRLLKGLVIGIAGGWLVWVVRPHLLAMVMLSAGAAYTFGHVRRKNRSAGSLLTRPTGTVVVALLVVFTVGQGANALGLKDLSINSVDQELNAQTAVSSQGGSKFDNGGNASLNPLRLPVGAVTVLLRPFPWEVTSGFQLLASLESVWLAWLIFKRRSSFKVALARARTTPFLLFCWTFTGIYAMAFASFANFGLLTRQRSLVLPALYVLLSVEPALAQRETDPASPTATTEVPPRVGI